ncbi:hypothetical protein ACFSO0_09915 [Brevibacillus sp. GCM10020057]|uniref:hypothetical protein n=1 Tax=Brevibacillus sp. GCM10020057 TaxID=3317327 RepID=UPI00362954CF
MRELGEELGLSVAFAALEPNGAIRDVGIGPGMIDKELCHVFAYACDQPLHAYELQPEEVTGLFWVNLDDLETLFFGKRDKLQAAGFLADANEAKRDVVLDVGREAFVPHESHYYTYVFSAVRRLGAALLEK